MRFLFGVIIVGSVCGCAAMDRVFSPANGKSPAELAADRFAEDFDYTIPGLVAALAAAAATGYGGYKKGQKKVIGDALLTTVNPK